MQYVHKILIPYVGPTEIARPLSWKSTGSILKREPFPAETIPELIGMKPGIVVVVMMILIIALLYMLAVLGF